MRVAGVLNRVLVANRGEIARRVIRTCRDLGIATVAVYSDADARSPHVAEADAAVRLPGAAAADTYLRSDLLVAAALRAGADAVHPGYGFLSENAAFAAAVQEAGLVWVGPPPAAIDAMGSKIRAKQLMADAGVPVLADLNPAVLTDADMPVLIKASAGGGGRGMRIVRSLAQLPAELSAARYEAEAAFGDPTVFCEPYLARGRHIEVQILADDTGTIWAIGERECSIQRRHQKIIEEAPSPLVETVPGMRAKLLAAARAAAAAVGYRNAGTVEFLAAPSPDPGIDHEQGSEDELRSHDEQTSASRFYFLEMNTRLQVEHPVTECTTGLDLVALQLQIAAGLPLPAAGPPRVLGHAIEARLYAEDPGAGWQPQTGTMLRLEVGPPRSAAAIDFSPPQAGLGHGQRLDSGVVSGDRVSAHYDPMLAKVISWAPGRHQAAAALAAALAGAKIHGLVTNRDLLVRILRHRAFLAGQTDTAFLDSHDVAGLAAPLIPEDGIALSALAAALADAAGRRQEAAVLGGLPSGWRNVPSALQRKCYDRMGSGPGPSRHSVGYRLARDELTVDGRDDIRLVSMEPDLVVLEVAGVTWRFAVARYAGLVCVDSGLGPAALRPVARFAEPVTQLAAGSLIAPMPGTVGRVAVLAGDRVKAGQPLLWLEAMKMEHVITAPSAGIVVDVPVAAGQQVDIGSVLAVIESAGADAGDRPGAPEEELA